jgi:hypothetical protein
MTTAITIMAKQRGGPAIAAQLLYYPVTDANFDTGSYQQFATHYWLSRQGMQWYWDQYTTNPDARAQITASPLRATLEELAGLPPALVIVRDHLIGLAGYVKTHGQINAALNYATSDLVRALVISVLGNPGPFGRFNIFIPNGPGFRLAPSGGGGSVPAKAPGGEGAAKWVRARGAAGVPGDAPAPPALRASASRSARRAGPGFGIGCGTGRPASARC